MLAQPHRRRRFVGPVSARQPFRRTTSIVALVFAHFVAANLFVREAAAAEARKPNIIFIMADDK